MANPLLLPPRLLLRALDDLHVIAHAAERLPDLERDTFARIDALDERMRELPAVLEQTLRGHFERQIEVMQELRPELVANRENSGNLLPKVDDLTARIESVHQELRGIREELAPLQAVGERLERLTDRLPGT